MGDSARIGLVTIGQAPRTDIVPAIRALLSEEVHILEAGCLDGMDRSEIAAFRPAPGDYVLTSRLADGSSVVVARRLIENLVERSIRRLAADGAKVIAILCTGEFPNAVAIDGVTIVYPHRILASLVAGVLGEEKTLGVLFPLPEQRDQTTARWQQIARRPIVAESASPYGPREALTRAAEALRGRAVDLVVMDGAAYTPAMKADVRAITNRPVMVGYSVLARLLAELA